MIPPREDSEVKADGQGAKEEEKVDGYKTNKEDLAVLVSCASGDEKHVLRRRLRLSSFPRSWPTLTSLRPRHLKH